jgi:hypothetical protein
VEGEQPMLNMKVHLGRINTEECACFVVISVGNEENKFKKKCQIKDVKNR